MIRVDRDALFSGQREAFGPLRQSQVVGINAIADGMGTDPLLIDPRHAAYMLATAWHETAQTMLPVAEIGVRAYFNRYDPVLANTAQRRQRAKQMGNTQEGDGYRYRGRGYVQLTWKQNYRHAGQVLNADLVGNPDLALDPGIAYRIMSSGMLEGWFTGKKLADYIHGDRTDFLQARRVINGLDRARDIEEYANRYMLIIGGALRGSEPVRLTVRDLPIVHDSAGIRALQRTLGTADDGRIGPATYRALIERVSL